MLFGILPSRASANLLLKIVISFIIITDSWFAHSDIIKTSQDEIESNAFFHDPEHMQNDFVKFCLMAIEVVKKLELKDYRFDQEQNENFDSLRDVISVLFEEKCKRRELKVSEFEKIIYRRLQEPYQTIMKMQKLFPGLGVALTCDFLKESHFCNIAKPDIHISHVFSMIDGFPYSMDLALVKRISEFAEAVCPASPNDFCDSGAVTRLKRPPSSELGCRFGYSFQNRRR